MAFWSSNFAANLHRQAAYMPIKTRRLCIINYLKSNNYGKENRIKPAYDTGVLERVRQTNEQVLFHIDRF